MSAILKFDFQQKKRKQVRFSEASYLNYTKKDQILHVTTTFSLKQGETRTNSVPIPHALSQILKKLSAKVSCKSGLFLTVVGKSIQYFMNLCSPFTCIDIKILGQNRILQGTFFVISFFRSL